MSSFNSIGVITGGGDSPGINATLRAIVKRAIHLKIQVFGFHNGWTGLLENDYEILNEKAVSGIVQQGGTILGSSRTNPSKSEESLQRAQANYEKNDLTALIAIGGDDTMRAAHNLNQTELKVIGIPQTIDNDVAETNRSIGFSSALREGMIGLDKLHTTASSHHRILIQETMGRDAGWICLYTGIAGGADIIIIPEKEAEFGWIKDRIKERSGKKKHFSLINIAEGATISGLQEERVKQQEEEKEDQFGHEKLGGIGDQLRTGLEESFTNKEKFVTEMHARNQVLGYYQRGGRATAEDRLLATKFGLKAIELIQSEEFGVMTALQGGKIKKTSLKKAADNSPRLVPKELPLLQAKDLFY